METEPKRLLSYLSAHGYSIPWSLETLCEYCIPIRVERGADVLAYLWASWREPGVLDFHACHGRRLWLSREVLERLYVVAELFGAHTLLTTPYGERAPAIRHLLLRQGFEEAEGAALTKRLDNILGPLQRAEDPAGAAGSTPSAPAATPAARQCDDPGGV